LKRAGGLEEIAQKYARLFVSNAYMAALAPTFDRGELKGRTNMGVWVLEKSTGKWIKRNFPTGLGGFRAFGPWMAGYAVESNLDLNRLSPGHEARKAHSTKCCIPLDERIAEDDVYLPGRLILFNIHSQKTIEIPTGDADSEVILITDNRICYRVGRKLFEATISADGITEVKTLLADDLVQDIHWAFFK
jgi:hypothetical protein